VSCAFFLLLAVLSPPLTQADDWPQFRGPNRDGVSAEKGLLVGDAATRIKQTLMFDLPIVNKAEVQDLLKADVEGGGKRVSR
jgi:hypothetical protein